jgi:hypothetical protein
MRVFASLPNILALPPNTPLVVSNVSELCLETCVNVFRRDTLLAEKLNDSPLVVLGPLKENRGRTDLATIIRNVLLI